jgi:hypothetical protein
MCVWVCVCVYVYVVCSVCDMCSTSMGNSVLGFRLTLVYPLPHVGPVIAVSDASIANIRVWLSSILRAGVISRMDGSLLGRFTWSLYNSNTFSFTNTQ